MLKKEGSDKLSNYRVDAASKKYEFWQRDSLAVHLYSQDVAYQILDYIHSNPLTGQCQLVKDPCEYEYSTAQLYEMGINKFSFIKDLRNEF